MDVKASIGLVNMVTLVLIVLKLAKVIKWSWIWVLCPTWIATIVFGMFMFIAIKRMK